MISKIFLLVSLAVSIQYYIKLRKFFDLDRDFMYRIAPGPCRQVLKEGGAEDIIHIGDGIFLISAGFSFSGALGPGQIKVLNTNGPESVVYPANITNAPPRPDFMTAPHGIATWKDPKSGLQTLYVLTHPVSEDRVEVFDIQRNGNFRYVRTITDPQFKYMNNLVLVDRDKFYITKFSEYREVKKLYIDLLFGTTGDVYYYDGSRARAVVSEGYRFANGINKSPDGSTIYVAEFLAKTVHAYRRNRNNNLVKLWSHYMGTGVDNIEVDQDTGDLWIATHPLHYKTIDWINLFSYILPSQAIKVKIVDGVVSEIVEVYADDGREISSATVATYYNGKFVIGSVYAQTVVCDAKYID